MLLADGETEDGAYPGIVWTVTKLLGWWETAPIRASVLDVQPIGQIVTGVRINARPIVLQVLAHSPDRMTPLGDLTIQAFEIAKAAFRCLYVPFTLVVNDDPAAGGASAYSGPLHASVKLAQPLRSEIVAMHPAGVKFAARVEASLIATDPYLYDTGDLPFD